MRLLPASIGRRTGLRFVCLLLAAELPALAQPDLPAPETAWRRLQALLAPPPSTSVSDARPAAGAARAERIAQLSRAAAAAQAFRQTHAGHPLADRAHRLEVLWRLAHARLAAETATTQAALAQAADFRAAPHVLREYRFEVALAAERLRVDGAGAARPPGSEERIAAALLREFGPIPEVLGLFAGLATRADLATANRLATQVLELRPPEPVRTAAEAVTTRYGLVGRPFGLRLARLDGSTFELPAAAPAAGPTVLYVWTPHQGQPAAAFAPLGPLRGRPLPAANWIFLGLGASRDQALAARPLSPFAGVHCRDDGGPGSAVAQRLRLTASPTVFVLDRRGTLTGFGRVDELPALLAAAVR